MMASGTDALNCESLSPLLGAVIVYSAEILLTRQRLSYHLFYGVEDAPCGCTTAFLAGRMDSQLQGARDLHGPDR